MKKMTRSREAQTKNDLICHKAEHNYLICHEAEKNK